MQNLKGEKMINRKWYISLSAIVLSTSIIASGCFGGEKEQEESNSVESKVVQKVDQIANEKSEKNTNKKTKQNGVAHLMI